MPSMSDPSFLINGGTVITMDDQLGIIQDGQVLVEGGRVAAVGARVDAPDVEIVDATGMIVLPGFIDTHRHVWQSVLRGTLPNCTLGEYFGRVMIHEASRMTPDDVFAGTLAGAYAMLNAGITTVADWANVANSPAHADAGIAALREAGIRALYGYGWPGGAAYLMHSELLHPEDARRFAAEHFSSSNELLTLGMGLRGPSVNPPAVVQSDWELARDLGARIGVHVGMRIPGVDVHDIEVLDELGLLGADTTFAHCNNTTDDELLRIAASGAHVTVASYSEMVMGHGRPPLVRLREAGLEPSLSVDVVCSVPGDMFTQMRSSLSYARISTFLDDPSTDFAPTTTAEDVLRFATKNGAAGVGLDDRIGSLTPGKDADIVLLDATAVNTFPGADPVGTVVTQMDTSNVDTVFVKGRTVKRGGKLVGVDLARVRSLVESASVLQTV